MSDQISSTNFINKNISFKIFNTLYVYNITYLVCHYWRTKFLHPKKLLLLFMTIYVSLLLEEIFKYERLIDKTFHLGRVGELTYIHCQYLGLSNVWLLFSVTHIKHLTNNQTVTLFFHWLKSCWKIAKNNFFNFFKNNKKSMGYVGHITFLDMSKHCSKGLEDI